MVAKRSWTPEVIVEEIRRYQAEGDLTMGAMRREDPRLVASAVGHFGSWRAAVEAAGIKYEEIRRQGIERRAQGVTKWRQESVLREVQRQWRLGEDVRASAVKLRLPGLYSAAKKLFGTWPAVLEAAGVSAQSAREARRMRRGWKGIWLERLRRQAEGREDPGRSRGAEYQRAFEMPDEIADENWLGRLES